MAGRVSLNLDSGASTTANGGGGPSPQSADQGWTGSTPLRVRYCECDPMGVAHHAAYAPWLEIARTELLRARGMTYAALESAGSFLVITKLAINYRRPVKYDDVVEIRVRVVQNTSRVKLEHEYEVVLLEAGDAHAGNGNINHAHTRHTGDVLATAATTLACVDRSGRVCALQDWLK